MPSVLRTDELIDIAQRAKIFKALSDPTRLRIVQLLACHAEMTGSEIADEAGISYALLCHHSKILCEAGIIGRRKEAQTTHTWLNREFLRHVTDSLFCDNQ